MQLIVDAAGCLDLVGARAAAADDARLETGRAQGAQRFLDHLHRTGNLVAAGVRLAHVLRRAVIGLEAREGEMR